MSETPSPTLAATSAQMLSLLSQSPDLDAFLDQLVQLASHVVTPAAACGLTVRRNGEPFTTATNSPLAAQLDEIQYGADEGPCLQALRTGETIEIADLVADQRWPSYRPHAIAHGVVSSLSLPLTVNGQTIAALNLYSASVNAFAGTARQHAEAFAGQSCAALAIILRQVSQTEIHQQLGEAMASRSIIDQAVGILMGQQRCG